MSQPEISPLARRLAEENNVEWRGLHGSGAGGKVVERDVLEYLARVMAGEEDVDPTPEPVPDGLDAWPDDDVRSFQQEVQASRRDAGLDEIQQELSAADRLGGGSHHEGGAAEDEAALLPEAEDISEDIFLFGDEAGDAGGEAAQPEPEETAWPSFGAAEAADEASEDALLVAGEEGFGEAGMDASAPDEASFDAGGAPPEGATQDIGDLPDVFGAAADEEDVWQTGSGAALFAGDEDGAQPEADDALAMPGLGEVEEARAASAGDVGGYPRDDAWAVEPPEAEEAAFESEPSDEGAGAVWDVEAGPVEAFDTGYRPAAREEPAPSAAPPEEGRAVPAASFGRPAFEEAVSAAATEEAHVADDVPARARELPLVSYGTLLRRHVDLTALAGAQLAVGLELGAGEPLSPTPFLLRAAAKAVADGAWGDGSLSMLLFEEDGGITPRRFDDAARQPFMELVQALATDGGATSDAPAALSVVDMSALDVDEAVLNVGGPLLTLGRILYDNQRGSYRSTLSLAGEVPAERGARLLGRVAELLDAPVRLML
ncbi:MAG TPA: E3 binding domain-containing protein [Trueperaceae bacterium]|nr:E3 binding domain-containing protein [Trueperaceae bacterium]